MDLQGWNLLTFTTQYRSYTTTHFTPPFYTTFWWKLDIRPVELLDDTDKSIKVKYGIYITYLPKKLITFDKEIPNIIEEVAEEQKRIEGKNKQLESGDKEDDEWKFPQSIFTAS